MKRYLTPTVTRETQTATTVTAPALRRRAAIEEGERLRGGGAAALSHCRPGRARGRRCAKRVAVPRKLSMAYPRTQPSHSGHRPKGIESRVSNRYSYTRVHNSTNHNRETRKQPQTPSTNKGQNMNYMFSAVSLSLKHSHTRYGMARGTQPDTKTKTVRAHCYKHRRRQALTGLTAGRPVPAAGLGRGRHGDSFGLGR